MALQIRRGTNAERLGITLVEGEVVYVTDFSLATIEVTSIDAASNVLTTTLDHGLTVNDQILFQSDTSNGLTAGTVYYVKTAPTNVTFTLSTTQGGATLDITGTATSLVFATGPTNASGTPYGYTISALYVGDGVTAGGNPAGSSVLDDLYDVEIGTYGGVGQYGKALADGQMLVYNADTSRWENNNEVSVSNVVRTGQFTRKDAFNSDDATDLRTALRVKKELTDATSGTDKGGPAILFQTDGTTTEKSIVQLGAYNNSSGNHDFVVKVSNDDFTTPNTVILSGQTRTNINDGVLYVDKTNGRVGVNNTTPTYGLDVTGTAHATGAATFDSTVYAGSTLTVNNGTIVSNSATGTVMNTTATTVNAFGAGTAVTLGATTGTLTLRNPTIVGSQTTQNLFNTTATTLNIGGASTATAIGSTSSGTTTVGYDLTVGNDLRINGDAITTAQSTFGLVDATATTVNFARAATTLTMGATSGTTTVQNNLTVTGNLTVNGTTTTVNSTTLTVDDKNIELASGNTSDAVADGGGITIKGATDKTLTYVNEAGYSHFKTNVGFRADGRIETTTANGLLISPASGSTSFATGASYALRLAGTTGVLLVGNDVSIYGDTLTLNAGQTSGVNASITVERGAVDSTIQWNESADAWIISNNMVTDGYIGTNGLDFHFNNDDGTLASDAMVNLNVKRGAGSDVRIRWNENASRWQSTVDGSTYISLPNQALDTTSNPTFSGLTAGNVTVGVANDQTITTTSGNLTISSNGGTTTISDIISHTGASATFNNNVTLGSSSADTLTVNATPTFQSGATINNGLGVNGTTTLYDNVTIGSDSNDTLTVNSTTSFNNNVTLGSSSADTLTVNGEVAANTDITFANNGLDVVRGIKGTVGGTDSWQFGGGSTASDSGYAVIATVGDGNEPIYVRQYNGGALAREIKLLDTNGDTYLNDTRVSDLTAVGTVTLDTGSSYATSTKGVYNSTTTSTSLVPLISTFATTTARTAKILVQIRSGSNYQAAELLVLHDGTTAYITVSNEIIIGTAIVTDFNASIAAGYVDVTATMTAGTKYILSDYTLLGVY